MRKIIAALLVALLCAAAIAEGSPRLVEYGPVETDAQWHEYMLEAGDYAQCRIMLPTNGRLDLSVKCSFEGEGSYEIYLYDGNMESIEHRDGYHAKGAAFPNALNWVYDLAAGEYSVMIGPDWLNPNSCCKGNFGIKADFTPSAANDDRQDDTFAMATEYSDDVSMGFLSSPWIMSTRGFEIPEAAQDVRDYYWFLSKGGTYSFNLTPVSPKSAFQCYIYDEYYNELARKDQTLFELELPEGKAYVMVIGDSHFSGDYMLRITQ